MRIALSALTALCFAVMPASAVQDQAETEDVYGLGDITGDEGMGIPREGDSVNLSEEYGFGKRQNIDSFLGEYENPYAPLPEENSFKGSMSEDRAEIDEHRVGR